MITAPSPLAGSNATTPRTRRKVDLVVIHCAATPSGKRLGSGERGKFGYQSAIDVINAWHAARGFRRDPAAVRQFNSNLPSVGYHYVIDLDGTVYNGRHLDEVPAQAAGFNANGVGICMVGGVEPAGGRYTVKQWASVAEIVSFLLMEYHLPATAPRRIADASAELGYAMRGGVCGHRDLSPDLNKNGRIEPGEWLKTCPGFDVAAWLANHMQPLTQHIVEEA